MVPIIYGVLLYSIWKLSSFELAVVVGLAFLCGMLVSMMNNLEDEPVQVRLRF